MKYRITPRWALLPALLSLALGVGAPIAVASTPFTAQAAAETARCQIHAVLMSREGSGAVPPALNFLRKTLQSDEFAIYKGFHLVGRKSLKLAVATKAEATFESGHKLGLTLLGTDDTRIKLHADLSGRDGAKSLLSTDYSIEDQGLLMIGAGTHTEAGHSGKLFFAIQCGREK